jgi:hypothetical protein
MSDTPANFKFPHRTPVFTAVLVLVCFAVFSWLAMTIYAPQAATVDKIEGVRMPADRRTLLSDQRKKEQADSSSYGWVDRKAGFVRLPIDRAIELTVKEPVKK